MRRATLRPKWHRKWQPSCRNKALAGDAPQPRSTLLAVKPRAFSLLLLNLPRSSPINTCSCLAVNTSATVALRALLTSAHSRLSALVATSDSDKILNRRRVWNRRRVLNRRRVSQPAIQPASQQASQLFRARGKQTQL